MPCCCRIRLRKKYVYIACLVGWLNGVNSTLSQSSTGFYKSFENTVGKGGIFHYEQFLLFPQCFLPFWRTLRHFHQIWKCCLQTLSVWKGLKFVVWERVNSLPNDKILTLIKFKAFADDKFTVTKMMISVYDTFTVTKWWFQSLIGKKTLWEKEKMLVTSILAFSKMFSNALCSGVLKTWDCVEKS